MINNVPLERLKEIELEVSGDTQKYLENCSDNYSEYVAAAQVLFRETYKKIELFDKKYDILKYLSGYDKAYKINDIDLQISILKKRS